MLRYKNITVDKYFDGTCLPSFENLDQIVYELNFILGEYIRFKIDSHETEQVIKGLCDYVHDKCEYYYDKVDNYYRYTDSQYYYHKAQLKKHAINYALLQQMLRFYK